MIWLEEAANKALPKKWHFIPDGWERKRWGRKVKVCGNKKAPHRQVSIRGIGAKQQDRVHIIFEKIERIICCMSVSCEIHDCKIRRFNININRHLRKMILREYK